MNDKERETQMALWSAYVNAAAQFRLAQRELFLRCGYDAGDSIIELIRAALKIPGQRDFAIEAAAVLTTEAQMQLFDDLLPHAVALETKSTVNRAEQVILSLPRDWLAEKLRIVVEPLVSEENPEIETGLLGICYEVDHGLARELAQKALSNPDEHSKDVGQFFLGKLNGIP